MGRDGIPFLPATELASLIKNREISPPEAVDAYLERIERVDPQLNSYITVCAEEAREAACEAEREISQGRYRGALHGVPVAIKDQIQTKGTLTTDASRIRTGRVPTEDATVVTRLKEAGAILLGKLNMSEFALGDPSTSAFGPARNPWDLGRSPGGSSTGSGAATAAFLCATSLGEDTGGSIRGPAAHCGLVGLRPTWGRVSRYGLDGASWSIDTIGPISRTVADCAATIGVIAGRDLRDPYTRDVAVPDYTKDLTGGIKGIRVGVVHELMDSDLLDLDRQTSDTVTEAAKVLRNLGAEVREVSIPLATQAGVITRTITHVERVSLHPEWLRQRSEDYHLNTRIAFMAANLIPGQVYYKAQKLRAMLRNQVMETLREVDVLVHPTSSGPAPKLSTSAGVKSKEQAASALREGAFRGIYSLSGLPALSILCGFTSPEPGGLPLAMQIGGRPFEEATLLRVAHAYEQNTPWHSRQPPI